MNLYGLLTLALAAETQDPLIKLTQDPTLDLLGVALALAVLALAGYGYNQFSKDRPPVSRQSSTIPTWIQVIALIAILLIMIVMKNSY
jgi:uncharacterized membrane protein YidH (DUF202 family)